MAAFFSTQLDFILFFYGLAFLLLGIVSLSIARGAPTGSWWAALGLFGLVHGTSEWLDLFALIARDGPAFLLVRTTVMTVSFVLLMEAARLDLITLIRWVPGRWIYPPLLLLVAFVGERGGAADANAVARYAIGMVGAFGIASALVLHVKGQPAGARPWAVAAAIAFALYGIAAGAIVPAATFWPATVANQGTFASITGIPIQLVRGTLACFIAFSIWGIWGQKLVHEVSSPRYTKYLQRQFVWTLIAMAATLVGGWALTEYLGGIDQDKLQEEARSDLDLLASHLVAETASVDGMVKALAGSPSLMALLNGTQPDDQRANLVLQLDVEASAAKFGYLLNRSGIVIASTDRRILGRDDSAAPYFQATIGGVDDHSFTFDAATGETDYEVSHPVRDPAGTVLGVAVLKRSLAAFAANLNEFDRPFFLVDPHGIVILANKPEMMLRTLWPLPKDKMQSELSRQFGAVTFLPVVPREIVDATWIVIDGKQDYAQRRYVDHSQWSLVMWSAPQGIVASRVLGITITLLMAAVTLVYVAGRDRWIHDTVQLDRRLELERLAHSLDVKASTDPLTGAFNRRKFDQELAAQIARARRYGIALSVVMYDVDRFKVVNDTHGHQVGDKVLVHLAQLTAHHIRKTDFYARWGGEEFVILAPDSTGFMAYRMAENLRRAIEDAVFDDVGALACSFGVAQFEPTDTAETFLARADEALYQAKFDGRNRVAMAIPTQPLRSGRDLADTKANRAPLDR